jgi:hypothetical protein
MSGPRATEKGGKATRSLMLGTLWGERQHQIHRVEGNRVATGCQVAAREQVRACFWESLEYGGSRDAV